MFSTKGTMSREKERRRIIVLHYFSLQSCAMQNIFKNNLLFFSSVAEPEPEPLELKLFWDLVPEPEPTINFKKHFLQSVLRMLG